ncbi:DUF1365 domain-containing protein [Acidithiobacillus caldus]|uniref:DUF1365 domain-containing protein n=1 Tax=Acidithiobacillus caldus (strain SM-1) TaxID=990288 RepID=F9ZSF1_ACICS|nr:DUF1365 domain-containing protein [Acidithiobacillus caldus]AEK59159.1 conserved hypothetical protein [Acidithiobacillus caldus SM-1]AUW33546.1 DUF1365 domain-containing protein [Acidithiobacillus caldus]QER43940.1 hypothetical protein F0726_00860 [Acidithiobacillus caldus]
MSPASPVKGALLSSEVVHRRLQPRRPGFRYGGFHLCFDLADEAAVQPVLSGFCPVRFRVADHGARDGSPLLPWIQDIFSRHDIVAERIVLVCYPRLWGYTFKPVSFWLGLDAAGHLRGVLAEVNNTFGEHHSYVLAHDDRRPIAAQDWLEAHKVFHVSPFFSVAGHYRFRFGLDARHFRADIHYLDDSGQVLLVTQLAGERRDLSRAAIWRGVARYPLMTLAVTGRIHWQALKLWRAHIPFHPKPHPPSEEISS